MNGEGTNPVDVVEEFLAMQNVKREAAERLGNEGGKAAANQAIGQLMNELSLFGDAVKGTGQENSAFYQKWNTTFSGGEGPEALGGQYEQMEKELKEQYDQFLAGEAELPDSLRTVLERQRAALT